MRMLLPGLVLALCGCSTAAPDVTQPPDMHGTLIELNLAGAGSSIAISSRSGHHRALRNNPPPRQS